MNIDFHVSMRFNVKKLNKCKYTNESYNGRQQEFHINKKASVLPEANGDITSSYQKLYLRPSLAP